MHLIPLVCLASLAAALQPAPPDLTSPPGPRSTPDDANQPWRSDLRAVSVLGDSTPSPSFHLSAAAAPSLARDSRGTLYAVFQWYPQSDPAASGSLALHRSFDNARAWTPPRALSIRALPGTLLPPSDPVLVVLPDDSLRLYFLAAQRTEPRTIALYSAISRDGGESFTFEPGQRFQPERGAPCAIARRNAEWLLVSTDSVGPIRATSADGLTFTHAGRIDANVPGQWIGSLVTDGDAFTFFGQAGPNATIWRATSTDGKAWTSQPSIDLRGSRPAAVRPEAGRWFILASTLPSPVRTSQPSEPAVPAPPPRTIPLEPPTKPRVPEVPGLPRPR